MFKHFTDNLKKILIRAFGILDANYIADVLDDMGVEIDSHLAEWYEVRFALFQSGSVELKAAVLFPTERDAEEVAKMSGARVGMVLVAKK